MYKLIAAALAATVCTTGWADQCEISIEGVTESSSQDEVVLAWKNKGLAQLPNPAPSRRSKDRNIGSQYEVVRFQQPTTGKFEPGLVRLSWERSESLGTLKIESQYLPEVPRDVNGWANKMELWSLWPMIQDRKQQCEGAASLRMRDATRRCQDKPGHLVVDIRERAYVEDLGPGARRAPQTKYACQYQFNAGPGALVTEKLEIEL